MADNNDKTTADGATPPRRAASSLAAEARRTIRERQAQPASFISDDLAGRRADLAPPTTAAENDAPLASLIRLTLDQVDPYDRNPRHKKNENFHDIKESIRKRNLEHRLVVTQRPGDRRYVLAAGGGTRYKALRELWNETQERRFYELDFEFRAYTSEADLFVAHISENIHRADMCFWDKANAIIGLKHELEVQLDRTLSSKEAADQFEALGLPSIGRTLMALYQFAVNNLGHLGETTFELSMLAVRTTINTGYNSLQSLASKFDLTKQEFNERIWAPTLQAFAKAQSSPAANTEDSKERSLAPDWDALIAQAEFALAEHIHVPLTAIPRMLETLRIAPSASIEELRALIKSATPTPGGGEQEAIPPGGAPDEVGATPRASTRTPGVFASPASPAASGEPGDADQTEHETDTDDRPPEWAVQEAEARERARRQAGHQTAALPPAGASAPRALCSALDQDDWLPSETSAALSPKGNLGRSMAQRRHKVLALATELASHSRSLEGHVIETDQLPMGWMVDLPPGVLEGTSLGPQAKQILWLLARASFQLHIGMRHPTKVSGSRFAVFLASLPLVEEEAERQWALIKPADGFDFLLTWLIDPQYIALGALAKQLLTETMQTVANHPAAFLDLNHALDFEDLQESHQMQRRQVELDDLHYFVSADANQEMVSRFFPQADLSDIRFRPGRVAAVDLKTDQFRIYRKWGELQVIPSERARLIALHKEFPQVSISSLYYAIQPEG